MIDPQVMALLGEIGMPNFMELLFPQRRPPMEEILLNPAFRAQLLTSFGPEASQSLMGLGQGALGGLAGGPSLLASLMQGPGGSVQVGSAPPMAGPGITGQPGAMTSNQIVAGGQAPGVLPQMPGGAQVPISPRAFELLLRRALSRGAPLPAAPTTPIPGQGVFGSESYAPLLGLLQGA